MFIAPSRNAELRDKVMRMLGHEGTGIPVFSNYVISLIDPTSPIAWSTILSLFPSKIDVESLQETANRLRRGAFKRDLFTGSQETGGYKTIWQSPKSTP